MDATTRGVLLGSLLLQVATLLGLVVRQRVRRVVLLPVYLATVTMSEALRLARPELFSDWNLWAARELLVGLLGAGVAVEIATRVFARLPGAAARLRGVRLVILLVTLATLSMIPSLVAKGSWRFLLVTEILPRLAFGTAALCIATLGTMVFHLVPLDPLHRAVLLGLALYLVLYAGTLGSAATNTWGLFLTYHVTPIVYLAVLALWAHAAWRRESDPPASAAVVKRLQPWR
jgi:hypothetical protein